MIINNNKHISLIQDELIYQTNEFEKLLKKQAAKMFVDKQLYLCRYQGYDEVRGNIILKFDHKICFAPRKNETLQCFVSSIQEDNVKNWGGLTYENLRTNIATQFECKTVFFTYEKDHTIVGLSGVKVEDVGKYERDALVFLAPTDPPLQYIINLVDFLKQVKPDASELLKLDIENPTWKPKPLIVDEEFVSKLQTDFFENDTIIIQGPPGTGKTYLMALLCGALLKSDFRILVTALTNRALIELAEKEHLKSALEQGKVFKSALTADESKNKKTNGLQSFKSLSKQRPPLLLTTYYIMSQIATKAVVDEHFDYIIIEEASQAFLSTIALAKKLGKKCIIIGDIKQLEPIFHKEYAPENTNSYHWMICGLKAISFYLPNAKQYILTDSYRLTENSIKGTNLFYGDVLKSKSDVKFPLDFSNFSILKKYLNSYGGSSMIRFKLPAGRLPSNDCYIFVVKLIDEIKRFNTKAEIAVLAFHKDSIRLLQTKIFTKCVNTENVLVETIDRIQGLTTDFCIFFVPTESVPFALQVNRFNVATSRAKLCTLIITDETISSFYSLIDVNVKQYMLSLNDLPYNEEQTQYYKPKIEPENRTGLKVLGTIDLSKFEKPKKEISKYKENIYIIDTNVFVDQPDIISKINTKYSIALSAKVIDELDNLKSKLDDKGKVNVQNALKSINKNIDKRDLRMELSDISLLPDDFNTRSADNKILSVALRFKSENPILLTSDNGLQIKAKGLKITTITLREFLNQLKRR
jgi:DNA replication ATP-dependent helicase Dna2